MGFDDIVFHGGGDIVAHVAQAEGGENQASAQQEQEQADEPDENGGGGFCLGEEDEGEENFERSDEEARPINADAAAQMQAFYKRVDAGDEQDEADKVDEQRQGDTGNQFREADDGDTGDGDKHARKDVSAPIGNLFALNEGGDDVDTPVENDEEAQDFHDSGRGLTGVEEGVEAKADGDDALNERCPPEAAPRFLYGVDFFLCVWLCGHEIPF